MKTIEDMKTTTKFAIGSVAVVALSAGVDGNFLEEKLSREKHRRKR